MDFTGEILHTLEKIGSFLFVCLNVQIVENAAGNRNIGFIIARGKL